MRLGIPLTSLRNYNSGEGKTSSSRNSQVAISNEKGPHRAHCRLWCILKPPRGSPTLCTSLSTQWHLRNAKCELPQCGPGGPGVLLSDTQPVPASPGACRLSGPITVTQEPRQASESGGSGRLLLHQLLLRGGTRPAWRPSLATGALSASWVVHRSVLRCDTSHTQGLHSAIQSQFCIGWDDLV